jgi:hypothetical protein
VRGGKTYSQTEHGAQPQAPKGFGE